MTKRNRILLEPVQVKVTEIALRALTGREISDADKQYAASHLAAISATWSYMVAYRTYHEESGNV
jgi:hypothetical protein